MFAGSRLPERRRAERERWATLCQRNAKSTSAVVDDVELPAVGADEVAAVEILHRQVAQLDQAVCRRLSVRRRLVRRERERVGVRGRAACGHAPVDRTRIVTRLVGPRFVELHTAATEMGNIRTGL